MALTPGLQLPYGIQPVKAVPVDAYLGPFSGSTGNDNMAGAVSAANAAIGQAFRYQSMEVHLIITGSAYKFWYRDGILDNNLVEFTATTSGSAGGGGTPGGLTTQVQFNDAGVFGGDANFTFNKTTDTLTVTNLSGSLTRLSDGTPYLVAGSNVTIVTGSNGAVTISASVSGSSGSGLTQEQVLGIMALGGY